MRSACVLTFALFASSFCHAQAGAGQLRSQWRHLAEATPGTHIVVRENGRRESQECTLVWIDDHALACEVYEPTVRRVVYPVASVASVSEAPAHGGAHAQTHLAGPLLAAGVGAVLGGLILRNSGAGGIAFGAALGGSAGGTLAIAAAESAPRGPALRWPSAHRSRRFRF